MAEYDPITDEQTDADGDGQPDKTDIQKYVQELRNLHAGASDSESKNFLMEQIKQARDMYDNRASRNEWLDVAQNVGRALAQYGAARTNLNTGRDASQLNFLPAHDYSKDTDRAAQDRFQSNREAMTMYQLMNKERKESLAPQIAAAKLGAQSALESKKEEGRERRQQRGIEASQQRTDQTVAAGIQKLGQQLGATEKARTVEDLNKQIVDLEKNYTAANSIAVDLSSKDKKVRNTASARLQSLYGQAGIEPTQQGDIEKASQSGGFLGMWKSQDPEKFRSEVQLKIVDPLKKKLDDLRRQKEQLRPDAVVGAEQAVPPQPVDKITVQDKQGRKFKLPRTQLQQAISQGYTEIK